MSNPRDEMLGQVLFSRQRSHALVVGMRSSPAIAIIIAAQMLYMQDEDFTNTFSFRALQSEQMKTKAQEQLSACVTTSIGLNRVISSGFFNSLVYRDTLDIRDNISKANHNLLNALTFEVDEVRVIDSFSPAIEHQHTLDSLIEYEFNLQKQSRLGNFAFVITAGNHILTIVVRPDNQQKLHFLLVNPCETFLVGSLEVYDSWISTHARLKEKLKNYSGDHISVARLSINEQKLALQNAHKEDQHSEAAGLVSSDNEISSNLFASLRVKPNFFIRFTTNHPYIWSTLKWLAIGATVATILYFTGALAAIPVVIPYIAPYVLPVLTKLGALIIAPLAPVVSVALAATWHATKFVVNNILKPIFKGLVNCVKCLFCCGAGEKQTSYSKVLNVVLAPALQIEQGASSSNVAMNAQMIAAQNQQAPSAVLVSNEQDNASLNDSEDEESDAESDEILSSSESEVLMDSEYDEEENDADICAVLRPGSVARQ